MLAKLSKNNRKYMSKMEMVDSIIKQFELYESSNFPLANIHILLDHVLWAWTEFEGKYKGCVWWSEEAHTKYIVQQNKNVKLIHDHVVPRELIRNKVVNMLKEGVNSIDLFNWLSNHLIGCVITEEEDATLRNSGLKQSLGNNLDKNNIWNRYLLANISTKKINWE